MCLGICMCSHIPAGILHTHDDEDEHVSSRSFPPPGIDPFTLLAWESPDNYTEEAKERLEDAVHR